MLLTFFNPGIPQPGLVIVEAVHPPPRGHRKEVVQGKEGALAEVWDGETLGKPWKDPGKLRIHFRRNKKMGWIDEVGIAVKR